MNQIMGLHLLDIVGIAGCGLYILNYSILTVRRMYGDTVTYFMVNLGAASCVLLSLSANFNLAAAIIQSFWIVASVMAIGLRLRDRRRAGVF